MVIILLEYLISFCFNQIIGKYIANNLGYNSWKINLPYFYIYWQTCFFVLF